MLIKPKDINLNNEENNPLVQLEAVEQYEKASSVGDIKSYPSLELVRLEKIFFNKKKRKTS